MPENATRTKFRELAAFWATVTVARTLQGNRAIGEYLCDMFKKEPGLIKYYKSALDVSRCYGITSRDVVDNIDRAPQTHTDVPKAFGQTLRQMECNRNNRAECIRLWGRFIMGLPHELVEVANAVLDHDLGIPQLTIGLFNRVMSHVGRDTIPEPTEAKRGERGLAMFEREKNSYNTVYGVYWDGTSTGHLILENTALGNNALRVLVAAGVILVEPK